MLLDQPDRSEVMQWVRRGNEYRGGSRCTALRQRADHAFGLGHRVLARALTTLAIFLDGSAEKSTCVSDVRRRGDHRGVTGLASWSCCESLRRIAAADRMAVLEPGHVNGAGAVETAFDRPDLLSAGTGPRRKLREAEQQG
jgi:hypothetical protein